MVDRDLKSMFVVKVVTLKQNKAGEVVKHIKVINITNISCSVARLASDLPFTFTFNLIFFYFLLNI